MIYDAWMPEHPRFNPNIERPWELPPPQPGRCQHKQPQWFTRYFDPNTAESKNYYLGSRDVTGDNYFNRLSNTVASVQTCFELPHNNALFDAMMDRPDLLFQWHNPISQHWLYQLQCTHGALPAPVSCGSG